ncbi:MAG: PD40 domain-containing protein [Flavobacteriales bacterium]|nr:PD40 domain-containing protein [Flavobacteriales bacterium]
MIRNGIILIVSLMVWSFSYGQKFSIKHQKKYEDATYYFELTDYVSAYEIYVKLHKIERDHAEMNYRMGVCVMRLGGDLSEAAFHFSEAASQDYGDAFFQLAQCYHRMEDFKNAIRNYQYYKEVGLDGDADLEEVNRQIDISSRAMQMLQNPVGVRIENVGEGINSEYADYVPVISKNDSIMLFTSRREGSTGGEKDPYNNYFEDIYFSYSDHGEWQKAQNLGGQINTKTHDASVGLSPDGKTLIMFRTNEELTGGDLYFSTFKNTNWQTPKKLGENINSEYAEASASITSDGNVMYFSSNRPGGYGGQDIYRSVLFANGDWSLPTNLGPIVNSKYDDDAPFISSDGNTLYFSSKGHGTIGGFDIFKVELGEDAKLWLLPQNLGYPINTVHDDIYFVMTEDEKTGYYSSSKEGGYGSQDIYRINLVDQNKLVVILKGEILAEDGDHKIPVKVKITVINEDKNLVQGVYKSNAKPGKFLMALQPYVNYKFVVSKKGYQTVDQNLFYPADENFTEFDKKIVLKKSTD